MEFLADNALFVVLIIALICWAGIMTYLFRLDNRITSLEKNFDHHPMEKTGNA